MKKQIFICTLFIAVCSFGFAQTDPKKGAKENIYTSLKPADPSPAVFTTQEELNAKVQVKKDAIINQIKENASDPKKVKQLREDLWRFENAIVESKK